MKYLFFISGFIIVMFCLYVSSIVNKEGSPGLGFGGVGGFALMIIGAVQHARDEKRKNDKS